MLSIPLMNHMSTAAVREAYLSELQRADAGRVFLFVYNPFDDTAALDAEMELLSENIKFYRAAGLEVGVWINGFGHGGAFDRAYVKKVERFVHIRDLHSGADDPGSVCPLDGAYIKAMAGFVRRIAKLRPDMIMFDDDLRISMHGAVGIGCACDSHMELFSRFFGKKISRKKLAELVFTGAPNVHRRVWQHVMGETMRTFAQRMREAVDAAAPEVRLGQCACLTSWDADGVDALEISELLAGQTRPFLRLIGAPYWKTGNSFGTNGLASIIETERMQLFWCRWLPDIPPDEPRKRAHRWSKFEVMAEGDSYPRPRYRVPASYLECFDQALAADGQSDGILKYMLDYSHSPGYETGYIDRHVKNAALRQKIQDAFGGPGAGIYCHELMRVTDGLDCGGLSPRHVTESIVRPSVKLCCAASIPITWDRDNAQAAVVFGESARHLDGWFSCKNMIVDGRAAAILGEESGLLSAAPLVGATYERFGDERVALDASEGLLAVTLAPDCEVLSWFVTPEGEFPASWRRGRQLLGFAFDAMRVRGTSTLFSSYPRQRQIADHAHLPAFKPHEPGLYIQCKSSCGHKAIGLWNLGLDTVLPGKIELNRECRMMRPVEGQWHIEGGELWLDSEIPPFGFAGVVIE